MKNKWVALLVLPFLLLAATAPGEDYKLAEPGYNFAFPRDYFNHEDYQTEWWYYTGNLKAADGHRFGFELTFFRQGVSREENPSPWYVHDLWMAHIALSDITGQQFYNEERLNRAGPGIAGVDAASGLVWNGNWQAQVAGKQQELRGVADKFALELTLQSEKQPVIQGLNGASQKAAGNGHASHYFSLTRLLTSGSIRLGDKSFTVEGTSWMDHEFFTGSMAADETGWDWLSMQLTDHTELMLYRLRHKDGSIDPFSSGSYVDASGKTQFLTSSDFKMMPSTGANSTWTSQATKATYPIRWHLEIPRLKLELDVTTPLPNQELASRFGTTYWEGAVDLAGVRDQSPLQGVGYLEMVGYAQSNTPVIPR